MNDPLISLRGVGKCYGKRRSIRVLHDVTIDFRPGEFTAIMGPSGSGKSTLLNLIGCLDQPTEGEIELDGVNITQVPLATLWKIRNQKMGFVFQRHHLIPSLTALENVMLPLRYANCARVVARERAKGILDELGLGHRLKNRPGELSGGEQARVAMARALVNDPDLLLADEPTGELDSQTGEQVLKLLASRRATDNAFLIVTHEKSVADRCDRVVRIKDGRIQH